MEEPYHARDQMSSWTKGPSRRAVVKGAVWSVPVVALATAVPAQAASPPCPAITVTRRVEVPEANTKNPTDGPREEETLSLPSDVTTVEFEVLGGGGGISYNRLKSVGQGTNAELVVGKMVVPAGSVLTLIAGNGGASTSAFNQGTRTGGQGYGNGGDSFLTTDANKDACGGGGGGGSAILVNNTPAVIAGGGGGCGVVFSRQPRGQSTDQWNTDGGAGGDAAAQGQDLTLSHNDAVVPPGTASGGGGAMGATPGTGRGNNTSTGTSSNGTTEKAGASGGTPGTGVNGGADGANGSTSATLILKANSTRALAAAGGGGGYAGGASGGIYGAVSNQTGDADHLIFGSGGGGGGSSYTSPTYVFSSTTTKGTNRPTDTARRSPGYVQVTYETCTPE